MAQESWERDQGSAGCKQSDRNILCANNCGFFGSAATLNMCSQCYGEHVAKTMQAAATTSSGSSASASPPRAESPTLRTDPCPSGATSGSNGAGGSATAESLEGGETAQRITRTSFTRTTAVMPAERSADTLMVRKEIDLSQPSAFSRPQRTSSAAAVPHPVTIDTRASSASASVAAAAASAVPTPAPAASSSRVIRCTSCKRRVGLTGFKCRCGDMFCSIHRYSDKHACTFDYKTAGREAIAKANPVVKADKVARF